MFSDEGGRPGHADGEALGVGARIGGVERRVRAEDESPVHVAVDGEAGVDVLVLRAEPDVVVALLPGHEPGEGVLGLPGMVDLDLGRLPLLIGEGERSAAWAGAGPAGGRWR